MAFDSSDRTNEIIAENLLRAHRAGQSIQTAPLAVPADASAAMHIQALVQAQLARSVGGWKVAIGPEKVPVSAPLLDILPDACEISLVPDCMIEVELAVRLRKDLPKRASAPYTRAEILDAVESLVLGIEVIGGRYARSANVPFLMFLADHLGNRAYVIGDELPLSAIDEAHGLTCRVTLDGTLLHEGPATHPAGDPLLPLLAYANTPSDALGGLKAGQLVTTGTLCGVLPVQTSGLLTARLGDIGQITLRFIP